MIDTMIIYCKLKKDEYNRYYNVIKDAAKGSGRALRPDEKVNNRYFTTFLIGRGLLEIGFVNKPALHGRRRRIEIKLKPKLLIDPQNYSDVTCFYELKDVENEFNKIIWTYISGLPGFFYWKCERIDFAVTITTRLVPKYIKLLKMGDIYKPFKQLADIFLHEEGSVYLMSDSQDGVIINFYDKYDELSKNKPFIGKEDNYVRAINKLRLEVQCKEQKLWNIRARENLQSMTLLDFCGDISICKNVISEYFLMIAGKQDYYKLENAITKMREAKYDRKYTDEELINTLKFINKAGCIWKAVELFEKKRNAFEKRIREIKRLGINPVLISDECEESHVENLFNTIINIFETIERGISQE